MKSLRVWIAAVALMMISVSLMAFRPALLPHALPTQKVFWERFFGKKEVQSSEVSEVYYIHDDASFEQNSSSIHFRPYGNPTFEFDIRLPQNWTSEDLTKKQSNLVTNNDSDTAVPSGEMVKLSSEMIGVNRIEVSISSQNLKREISAAHWLKNYIFSNGYALQGEIEEKNPKEATAYFSSISEQINYHTYVYVRISGNIAFITESKLPLGIKTYAAYVQKKIADSLKINYPKEEGIEQSKAFAVLDSVKFNYPASWTIKNPDFRDPNKLSLQLESRDVDGTVSGYIQLQAIRRTPQGNLMDEIKKLKSYFSDYIGINVQAMLSSQQARVRSPRFVFSRYEVYKAAYQKEGLLDPEVRLAVLGDKNWYIFAYLVTPRDQDNLAVWAQNVRTFDIFLEMMR